MLKINGNIWTSEEICTNSVVVVGRWGRAMEKSSNNFYKFTTANNKKKKVTVFQKTFNFA